MSTKPKILIIEDSHFVRDGVAKYLTNLGYDVTARALQSQAEKLIKDRSSFDLILLDGYTDFVPNQIKGLVKEGDPSDAERFLHSGADKGIPVVLISSQLALSLDLKRKFPQQVCGCYDKKPLSIDITDAEMQKLVRVVEEALDPRRQQEASRSAG